jgi:hypothetical protein
MAQTGFTPIVTYNTATATTVPSAANLAQGELAVNVTDKKLYTKDSGGNVVLLASNGGDVTGPASSTNLAIPTFSGTGGKTLLDNSGATISAGVITATGFSGPLNGTLGATTPSTAVVTSINKMAITAPATSSTLAVADGKTLTASNSLTLAGTDATTMTFPTTSATIARTDAAQTFTGLQSFGAGLYVTGSPTGFPGDEISFRTTGGVDSAISSMQTGGTFFFESRGTSSNMQWVWRNGTGGGSNRATLSGVGAWQWNNYGAGAITSDASGNLTAVSDESVKKNIRPFTRGLAEIVAIANNPKGVILYGYTEESGLDQTKNDYAGWSAQVVQQSIPEAVGKMKDEINDDGIVTKEGRLTLNPFGIVAAQTKAIAELNSIIEQLTKRINILELK